MDPTKYKVRNYSASDYPSVMRIWQELNLSAHERGDNHEVLDKTLQLGGCFLALEEIESSKIIGTSLLSNDGRRLYLHHFGILTAFQNRQLGGFLLEHTLQIVCQMRMQVKLEVNPKNNYAVRLYEKYGFKLLGNYVVYIIR